MKAKTFALKNRSGMTLRASNLGGTVMELTAPDRDGKFANILLSYGSLEGFHENGYANALIGRVANRIAGGAFTLDGRRYEIAKNDGANALHGGEHGFNRRLWDARQFASADGPALELTRLSPDGEEGFPGNLFVRVVYTLTEDGAWRIEYWAVTDAPTVFNPTNHAYFNLSGGRRDILGHELHIRASHFTPAGKDLVPTGEVLGVEGTPLDFRNGAVIGEALARKSPFTAKGFDHNFLRDDAGRTPFCAKLRDPESGREMYCDTTEPCVQLYTANFLPPGVKGRGGAVYGPRFGVCLETQHAPDAPNRPGFAPVRLDPGVVFHSSTTYAFVVS